MLAEPRRGFGEGVAGGSLGKAQFADGLRRIEGMKWLDMRIVSGVIRGVLFGKSRQKPGTQETGHIRAGSGLDSAIGVVILWV